MTEEPTIASTPTPRPKSRYEMDMAARGTMGYAIVYADDAGQGTIMFAADGDVARARTAPREGRLPMTMQTPQGLLTAKEAIRCSYAIYMYLMQAGWGKNAARYPVAALSDLPFMGLEP